MFVKNVKVEIGGTVKPPSPLNQRIIDELGENGFRAFIAKMGKTFTADDYTKYKEDLNHGIGP